MIGSVLAVLLLLVIAAAIHVIAVLLCHGGDRDNDQETGR